MIRYEEEKIIELLGRLREQPELLFEKYKAAVKCLEKNTWEQRAYKVERDLKGE